jgi:hypothetical protein
VTWLTLIRLGLSIISGIVNMLKEKRLLEAGAAEAILAGLTQAQEAVDAAIKARQDYRDARARGDIGDHDDDGYRRDD